MNSRAYYDNDRDRVVFVVDIGSGRVSTNHLYSPGDRTMCVRQLRLLISDLESDACLFPEERAARDAAFNMQGVPKP